MALNDIEKDKFKKRKIPDLQMRGEKSLDFGLFRQFDTIAHPFFDSSLHFHETFINSAGTPLWVV